MLERKKEDKILIHECDNDIDLISDSKSPFTSISKHSFDNEPALAPDNFPVLTFSQKGQEPANSTCIPAKHGAENLDTLHDTLAGLLPEPHFIFDRQALIDQYKCFSTYFAGLTTYAVKANPNPLILETLIKSGMKAFDVASIAEIELIHSLCPEATLHYHNPVKSRHEIKIALLKQVRTFSLDCQSELHKIIECAEVMQVPLQSIEISVRLKNDNHHAAYDFGTKFGATLEPAAQLLAEIAQYGMMPSVTFHPGTQCESPDPYKYLIMEAAKASELAGTKLHRLNVGGGFPVDAPVPLISYFKTIHEAMNEAFTSYRPQLVCEPGRAMVAECADLVAHVKLIRERHASVDVFLDDGIYGGLSEAPVMNVNPRLQFKSSNGRLKKPGTRECTIFGPTCDSIDHLPHSVKIPDDLEEGDKVIFKAMGAYASANRTDFNGYGVKEYRQGLVR